MNAALTLPQFASVRHLGSLRRSLCMVSSRRQLNVLRSPPKHTEEGKRLDASRATEEDESAIRIHASVYVVVCAYVHAQPPRTHVCAHNKSDKLLRKCTINDKIIYTGSISDHVHAQAAHIIGLRRRRRVRFSDCCLYCNSCMRRCAVHLLARPCSIMSSLFAAGSHTLGESCKSIFIIEPNSCRHCVGAHECLGASCCCFDYFC